jgi:uncharacterized protein
MISADIQCLLAGCDGDAQLIETHISWVILTGAYAYKLKKPVQFSFLDFSTIAQRQLYCAQELALNRRLSPTVYLSVLPICQAEGRIGWDVAGEVIDYAVQMRRLDAALEMDRMLAAGRIDAAYMELLARKIADFHLLADVITTPKAASVEAYRADFNDILGQSATIGRALGAEAVRVLEMIVAQSDDFLLRHAAHIAARTEAAWVRDVHGDLHARNIFAYPDPVIFDCIEFNAHLRQIDLLNEVAFFCMELEATGFGELAEVFLAAYLAACPAMPDPRDRALFGWFKAYRANVRAKVAALRAAQAPDDKALAAEMACYLGMIQRYLPEFEAA